MPELSNSRTMISKIGEALSLSRPGPMQIPGNPVAAASLFVRKNAEMANGAASNWFRSKRRSLFASLLAEIPQASILDVGGTVDFWRGQIPHGGRVTVLNVFDQEPEKRISVLVGDGCDLARFEDKSFDVVLAHSVLGHVGGWERQMKMAAEVRRVGQRYIVQTPNHRFFLDWRTLLPFFHWFSPAVQAWCFRHFPMGRYKTARNAAEALHWATRVRNLTHNEIQELFPDGTVVEEKIFGLTKSFMVIKGFRLHGKAFAGRRHAKRLRLGAGDSTG